MRVLGFFALWIFGLVVLAEALNKLERTRPCLPGLTRNQRPVSYTHLTLPTICSV